MNLLQSFITMMPMMVCLFWAAILLLDIWEHGDRAAHKDLLVWSMTAALLYMGHYTFFNGDRDEMPLLDTLYVVCNLLIFPLFLRYLLRLTEGKVSVLSNVLIFAPPFIIGGLVGGQYALLSPAETSDFIETYLYHNSFDHLNGMAFRIAVTHHVAKLLFAIGVAATLWIGMKKIRNYNHFIDSVYSDTEDKHLYGITTILGLMVITCIMSFCANFIGRYYFTERLWLLAIPSVIFSLLLFAIGYFGYTQRFSFADVIHAGEDNESKVQEQPAGDSSGVSHGEMYERIITMMKDEKLFLEPDLKVDDIAAKLCTNRRYVQQTINEEIGVTFSEYVNRMRIEHAKVLLQSNSEMTVQEVSEQSGYKTLSTFYRNFKKYKGCNPKTGAF